MVYVLVQQKVVNYDIWEKEFYKNTVRWETAGMMIQNIFRSADDAKRITLLFEVKDIILMHIHLQSSKIMEKWIKDGIITAMSYQVLEDIPIKAAMSKK